MISKLVGPPAKLTDPYDPRRLQVILAQALRGVLAQAKSRRFHPPITVRIVGADWKVLQEIRVRDLSQEIELARVGRNFFVQGPEYLN